MNYKQMQDECKRICNEVGREHRSDADKSLHANQRIRDELGLGMPCTTFCTRTVYGREMSMFMGMVFAPDGKSLHF